MLREPSPSYRLSWTPERRKAASDKAKKWWAQKRAREASARQSTVQARKPMCYELHGVWADKGDKGAWVSIRESGGGIYLSCGYNEPTLTIEQARYLAEKLYHLAAKIEARVKGAAK